MKAFTKKIITASVCLIAGGAAITGIGFLFGGRPGIAITSSGIRSNSLKSEPVRLEKTKLDDISGAEITIDSYADIHILPSEDNRYYLEYLLDKSNGIPEYHVDENKLTISQPHKNWAIFLATFATNDDSLDTYVSLYVPKDDILDYLKVYNDSGDVSISNTKFKAADISVEYGDASLKDLSFDSLKLTLDSGDLNLSDTKAGSFTLSSEYGDNMLKNFESDSAQLSLDSGNLYMDATKLGTLDCNSKYGDVTLLLPEKLEKYTFDVTADYGNIYLPNDAPRGFSRNRDDDEESYHTEGDSKNLIRLSADSGDIEIKER